MLNWVLIINHEKKKSVLGSKIANTGIFLQECRRDNGVNAFRYFLITNDTEIRTLLSLILLIHLLFKKTS